MFIGVCICKVGLVDVLFCLKVGMRFHVCGFEGSSAVFYWNFGRGGNNGYIGIVVFLVLEKG